MFTKAIKKFISSLAVAGTVPVLAMSLTACSSNAAATPTPVAEPTAHIETLIPENLPQLLPMEEGEDIAVITTSFGEIRMRFFPEYAPYAVENFITLANDDYYKDMIFHRVIDAFMIQTGDPTGTGTGGNSKWGEGFSVEVTPYLHFFRGAVGMARARDDYNSNRSQFFIVQNKELSQAAIDDLENYRKIQGEIIKGTDAKISDFFPEVVIDKYIAEGGYHSLDFEYTVFGQVYEGMDVVDKIAAVPTTGTEEGNKPLTDVKLISIEIQKYTKEASGE